MLGRMVWEIRGEKQDADPAGWAVIPQSSAWPCGCQERWDRGLAAGPVAVPGVSLCHPLFISALSQRALGAGRPQLCLFCCFPVRDKPAFPFFISC